MKSIDNDPFDFMKFPMQKILLLSVICVPLVLYAENEQVSGEQMQQIMENVDKMQECMGTVDQKAMDALAVKGEKVIAEIQNLCSAGNRDEAQNIAVDYGKELASSREIQAIQKCDAMAALIAITGDGEKPGHVCDGTEIK